MSENDFNHWTGQCPSCPARFTSRWELDDHVASYHHPVAATKLGAPIAMSSRIESAVRDVFEKRFTQQVLPYQQARDLTLLERELVGELVHRLCQ